MGQFSLRGIEPLFQSDRYGVHSGRRGEISITQKCEFTSPFDLYGKWWRSSSDQAKSVPGCLSYTPDHGVQLQLYDSLPGEGPSWRKIAPNDQPIWGEVVGFAGKRVKVSLFDVIFTNRPNDPKIEDETPHPFYFVNRAILGVHATNPASLRLKSLRFSVSDFEMFADTTPVAPIYQPNSVKVDYTTREPLELTLVDPNMQATIKTLLGTSACLDDRSCVITYQEEMKLVPETPIPFEEGIETVFSITNFFLMCAREAVDLRYIRGTLDSGEFVSSLGNMRRRKRRPRLGDWVLTVNQMTDGLEPALNRWFALLKKLRFISPVFFSEIADPSPVQDARLFHFAGCLEGFHREVVQPDRRTFAERIDALFNGLDGETQKCLTQEPERFLGAIKQSRNKLAHVIDETPGEAFEGHEYAHANLSLRAWLTILMLKECGIAESLIRDRMQAIGYFYWGPFKFEPRVT